MKDILDLTEKKDFDPSKFKVKKPKTVYRQRRVPWDKDGTDIHTRVNKDYDKFGKWVPMLMSTFGDSTSTTTWTGSFNLNNTWTYFSYEPLFDYVEDLDDTSIYESNFITANIFNTTTTTSSWDSNVSSVNYWVSQMTKMSVVEGVNNYYGMRTGKASLMKQADAAAYYNRAKKNKIWIEHLSRDTFKRSDYNKHIMEYNSDSIKNKLKVSLHDDFFDEYYHVGEFRKESSSYRYDYEGTYNMLTYNKPLDEETFENLIKDSNAAERYLYMRARKYNGKKKLKMKWFDMHDEYLRYTMSMRPRKEWRGVTEV